MTVSTSEFMDDSSKFMTKTQLIVQTKMMGCVVLDILALWIALIGTLCTIYQEGILL